MVAHGIRDRLAISWVMHDEQRASTVIEYVEAKHKKRQVKSSTAGYIRKLIEDKAEVGVSPYQAQRGQGRVDHVYRRKMLAQSYPPSAFKAWLKALGKA